MCIFFSNSLSTSHFSLYFPYITIGALNRELHMFWFQWTVLPLGTHKPTRAAVAVNVTVAVKVHVRQRTVIAIVVAATTSQPEATGFLILSQNLVDVGKVAPTANLSVASGFKVILGINGITVVPQLLRIITHGIPRPFYRLARVNQLLDEHLR